MTNDSGRSRVAVQPELNFTPSASLATHQEKSFLFLYMTTVFERLCVHCQLNNKLILNHNQKSDLGRLVGKAWRNTGQQMSDLKKTNSVESDGTHRVYHYPDTFAPTIDSEIALFYSRMQKRKRIPLKQFSAKVPSKEKKIS